MAAAIALRRTVPCIIFSCKLFHRRVAMVLTWQSRCPDLVLPENLYSLSQ